jgi:tetratricopeptide (TPR) repeat protein
MPCKHKALPPSLCLRALDHAVLRGIRSLVLLALLLGVVLVDIGCVKKVRTVNDNFYVINRRSGGAKSPAASSPTPVATVSQSTGSASEALKSQVGSGPRPKSSLSNTEILEEGNSTIAALLRKAQTDPHDASLQSELGREYYRLRMYSEALARYENALRLDPKNAVYHEQMGRLWRDWGYLQRGVDVLKTALELDPGFFEAWNTLGTIFDRQANHAEAQRAFAQALSLNADLDYVHSNLCFSYLQSGKVEEAVRHGERAIHLNPTMPFAHNNLAIAYGILGDLDRSLAEFKEGGDEAGARNNLGLILLKREQFTEAMEQFKLAGRLRPFYKEAATNYWRARELKFQKVREARARLRSFDRETAMEAKSGAFGVERIENAGLKFLGGEFAFLSAPPFLGGPGNPAVATVDIVSDVSCVSDESELFRARVRLGRVSVAPDHTTVLYKEGFVRAASELAHRILGDQRVPRTHSSDPRAQVIFQQGLDSAQAANQFDTRLCAKLAQTIHK